MRPYKKQLFGIWHNPFFIIGASCAIVFLAGEVFYSFVGRYQSPIPPTTATQNTTADWQTFTDESNGFSFRHPIVYEGPTTMREGMVEAYDALYHLVVLINIITTPKTPGDWLRDQRIEGYTNKPYTCFSQTAVTDVPSASSPDKTILHFDAPVLFLDNIGSRESQRGSCTNHPLVRILLIPHHGKIIRIIYTASKESETTVSTFRLLQP